MFSSVFASGLAGTGLDRTCLVLCRLQHYLSLLRFVQAHEDDREKAEAALKRSDGALEGERAELQRARDDLDRFSAQVSSTGESKSWRRVKGEG